MGGLDSGDGEGTGGDEPFGVSSVSFFGARQGTNTGQYLAGDKAQELYQARQGRQKNAKFY